MTGNVFAAAPLPPSHNRHVSMAYSIDSFVEYSTAAVGRTPTRAIVAPTATISFNSGLDEELFHDLFVDADVDDGASVASSPQKKGNGKSNATPSKAIVWQTGASLTKPFATPPPVQHPRPNQLPSGSTPSLSAPLPQQNAVDLMTARPQATTQAEETAYALARVPEVNEDDDDDGLMARLKTAQPQSARRVLSSLSPRGSLTKPYPQQQHETLQFLEKLDLKLLMAQPRPDVTHFLPQSNQMRHVVHDPRVETDTYQRPKEFLGLASSGSSIPTRKPLSSRKVPLCPLAEGSTRLAHVAQTYGTTATGPRTARKETLERLSNPISGHTSTLRALSPASRKKREAELGDWPPTNASTTPVTKMLTSKKTRDLIDRLSEAHPRIGARKLVKGKKPLKVTVRTTLRSSNNQDDVNTKTTVRVAPSRSTTLDERKAVRKQKLVSRDASYSEAAAASSGSTFLTQHEDSEAKLATNFRRSNRKLVPQRGGDPTSALDVPHFPQRPVVPPSLRTRASLSTTAASPIKTARPTPHKQSVVRTQASSIVKGTAVSPQKRVSRPRGSTVGGPTARIDRNLLASSTKTVATTTGASSVSSVLLGTAPKTPLAIKARARSTSRPESAQNSLPLIRRPAPAAPQRPAAPSSRRIHRIRTKTC